MPRESVVKLTDSHDMTIAVSRGRKTPAKEQQQLLIVTSHQQLGHTDSERVGWNSPLLKHYILECLASNLQVLHANIQMN